MSYHERLIKNLIPRNELDEAFSRSRQVDEYKHNVFDHQILDLKNFKRFIDLGIMHDQVTFIHYSDEAIKQWNIGNYVYPHKDGAKELDPYHVSLVAPMEKYKHSMIRWFKGFDDDEHYETLRTGRFMKNFEDYQKCELVDIYNFSDDRAVIFRVDVWHDVLIPFSGRLIMRWLFKQNFTWNQATHTLKNYLDSSGLHAEKDLLID